MNSNYAKNSIYKFRIFEHQKGGIMKSLDINTTLIEGYLKLLDNLSPTNKLDLISKLTLSVKTDLKDKKTQFYKAFGAWDSKESAEKIIADIKNSRSFKRQIEEF
jgi:hypothetical protein